MNKSNLSLNKVNTLSSSLQSGCSPLIVGIDASRNRSGGAIAHLRGLIEAGNPQIHGISNVHLWAHDDLIDRIGERTWLTLHRVAETRGPIYRQLWWQYAQLPALARALKIDVLFNSDAGSVCSFPCTATLSQDMLSFEPGEMQRYSWTSLARLRLEILKFVQLRRLKRSTLAIFLSEHARTVIGRYIQLPHAVTIPHGIDPAFRAVVQTRRHWPLKGPIMCLYISNTAPYKHQWNVVEAVARLRHTSAHDIRLRLVGGGRGSSHGRLLRAIEQFDPHGEFVELVDFAPHDTIPSELAEADIFIFASSCENLPITLLEAMASGIAICSSDRGPMPEVLGPEAIYFDPEAPTTITEAIRSMIEDPIRRETSRAASLERSASYTWETCAEKTWAALALIARGLS
ncbi:MAG: glycosyltransferase [Nitrosomonadaceae bacterium]|nr:glycosyltransferase [Nitrosomonadaceae bacterium]